MTSRPWIAAVTAACLTAGGCGGDQAAPAVPADAPGRTVTMPAPHDDGPMSLEEALTTRRSVRSFTGRHLTFDDLSQLMWAAQGRTEPDGAGRTAPSAGGTYPLEVYVATPDGTFHYLPEGHSLETLGGADLRAALADAALAQEWMARAAAVVVIAAVFSRTEQRYGDRAERYVLLEAGHAAQNVLLQATAMELAATPVGAFHDEHVQATLGLPGDHEPLYLIPVGHPAGG